MKDRLHKEYGRLSGQDIRLLLSLLDLLDKEEAELVQEILSNPRKRNKVFAPDAPQIVWAGYYELDFRECVAAIVIQFGMEDEMREIHEADSQAQALADWIERQKNAEDDDDDLTPSQWLQVVRFAWAMGTVLLRNLHSLMVHGLYINDLIKIAREGRPEKRDQALLNAIRIDPSVAGCPTGMQRISRAVLMRDSKFLSRLQLALDGKLGTKEQANFKKMRFVLQVLHEMDALQLSDGQLEVLFVKQLKLYSATASSAKNLSEFKRKFQEKKSTI